MGIGAPLCGRYEGDLLSIAAPLQRLRNIRGDEDAYRFDLLITRLQVEVARAAQARLRFRIFEHASRRRLSCSRRTESCEG